MVDDNKQAQDDNNDEYQYSDMDVMDPDLENLEDTSLSEDSLPPNKPVLNKDLIYKALFIVVLFIVVMMIYKFMGSIFSSKNTSKVPVAVSTQPPAPMPQPMVMAPGPVIPTTPSPEVTQKLATLDATQQSLSTDMSNLNNQVVTLGSSVSDLSSKVDQLNQTITALASQLAEQSQQIALLTAHARTTVTHVVHKPQTRAAARPQFYIQAVIPGRAWLISITGVTMTVRDGTNVPGYGVVKLIDPNEGRILTSSGRVIKFSQLDS